MKNTVSWKKGIQVPKIIHMSCAEYEVLQNAMFLVVTCQELRVNTSTDNMQ